MRSKLKELAVFFIGWPLSIAALYFILKTFLPQLNKVQHLLSNINITLFTIGISSFITYYFLRSILWQSILTLLGYKLPYQKNAFYWASSEFKRYIPGNIWSFVGRTVLFTNLGVSKSNLAKALLYELQFILLGAILTSTLALPFLGTILFNGYNFSIVYRIVLLFILTVICFYIFYSKYINKINLKAVKFSKHLIPPFQPAEIIYNLLISTTSFFFFGLGYYFTISSIVSLDVRLFLTLIGLFVLALLIGLFSFITPTGLGVREGAITFGLAKIIPQALAGFASIFGRISLIVSEIFFLLLSYLYSRFHIPLFAKFELFTKKHFDRILILILIIFFNLYFIPVSFLRHDNFYTGRFDLGNMDQTVWNTTQGRIFQFTNPDSTENISRLAFHADFILIALSPFYFIWPDPKMLLLTQSIVVSLGAIFIYLLAISVQKKHFKLQKLNCKIFAFSLAFSYLMNPSLQWSILYDFHAVTFATTFLLAAFYFMYSKKYFWFVIFAILAGLTKEQVWIPIAIMGLYLLISNLKSSNRIKYFGFAVFSIALTIFYYLNWHAIPNLSKENEHFALSYFQTDADSPSSLIKNIINNPVVIFNKILSTERINYLKILFQPLGFLPLLAPWFLLFPAADLILNILSDKPELHQIYYQYTAVITPFIYIASIFSIVLIKRFINYKTIYFISIYVVVMILISGYTFGPLPWTKKANIAMLIEPQQNKDYIKEKLAAIPANIKVSATNNLGAHLTHRLHLYTTPQGTQSADLIALLLKNNSSEEDKQLLVNLKNNSAYQVLWEKGEFTVFKRK